MCSTQPIGLATAQADDRYIGDTSQIKQIQRTDVTASSILMMQEAEMLETQNYGRRSLERFDDFRFVASVFAVFRIAGRANARFALSVSRSRDSPDSGREKRQIVEALQLGARGVVLRCAYDFMLGMGG